MRAAHPRTPQYFVGGAAVSLEAAVAAAARMLGASRLPVIAGCGTDIAGARAAMRLADAAGAVVDHMHADAVLRDLDVMREHGMMLTTPNETRRRADVVLLVGDLLETAGLKDVLPDLGQPSLAPLQDTAPAQQVLRLDGPALSARLQLIRSCVNGRVQEGVADAETQAMVDALAAAKFGVAVWAQGGLAPLAIEMLCGLVKDLNAKTRWSGLSLPPGDNAAGVLQAWGWMSGFPMRTSFARGYPENDAWLYDTARLVASGETDCVLWVSAFSGQLPAFRGVPMIVLRHGAGELMADAHVSIEVGCPGVDHDAVVHDARLGTLTPVSATASDLPSVAAILDAISHKIGGATPC